MNDSNESKNHTSSVDPGILEMGASVSVNDELRRNITAETVEIDNICTKLVTDLTIEEERAKDMEKSKHHSVKEQFGLLQSTREMSDTSHMNHHIFQGLKSRIEKEIMFKSSPQSQRNEQTTDGTNIVTPTDIMQHSPTSVFAIQHINNENKETVTTLGKKLEQSIEFVLAEKQKALLELEGNMGNVEAKFEDMKHVMSNKSSDLKKDLNIYHEKVTQLSSSLDEASNLIKQRDEAKDQFDHLRVDRGASFTMKMSLQSEITGMHKKLENDRRTIHNEKILAETISKSINETLEMDMDTKKDELEALIVKDKSYTEFLKSKKFPGKENLLEAFSVQMLTRSAPISIS